MNTMTRTTEIGKVGFTIVVVALLIWGSIFIPISIAAQDDEKGEKKARIKECMEDLECKEKLKARMEKSILSNR